MSFAPSSRQYIMQSQRLSTNRRMPGRNSKRRKNLRTFILRQYSAADRHTVQFSLITSNGGAAGIRVVEHSTLRLIDSTIPSAPGECILRTVSGTILRECLDFLIPLNERHLRGILKEWVAHYNKGRPHSGLGPGIPEPSEGIPALEISGHRIPCGQRVVGNSVLDGLHHEYRLEKVAA